MVDNETIMNTLRASLFPIVLRKAPFHVLIKPVSCSEMLNIKCKQ